MWCLAQVLAGPVMAADCACCPQARQNPQATALRQIEGHGDVDAVIDQNILLSTNAVLKVGRCVPWMVPPEL